MQSLAYNFIKKETVAQVFSCNFCEISKSTYFTGHLWVTASDHIMQSDHQYGIWLLLSQLIFLKLYLSINKGKSKEVVEYAFKTGVFQKQLFRGVSRKSCSENMQQIYWRRLMPKCDFNKVSLQLYWNCSSARVFSCSAAYFQNTFFRGTPLKGCFWFFDKNYSA